MKVGKVSGAGVDDRRFLSKMKLYLKIRGKIAFLRIEYTDSTALGATSSTYEDREESDPVKFGESLKRFKKSYIQANEKH